jgi:hypothetical protein
MKNKAERCECSRFHQRDENDEKKTCAQMIMKILQKANGKEPKM